MVNFITDMILIEKRHLISVFGGIGTPNNVLISSYAMPTRMKFVWRGCTWNYSVKNSVNGELSDNNVVFGFVKPYLALKKWQIDNEQKEFVAFVQLRNGVSYIIGSNNVGLTISMKNELNVSNSLFIFLKGLIDVEPLQSTYHINDFFVGRDFGDDFNIDFG